METTPTTNKRIKETQESIEHTLVLIHHFKSIIDRKETLLNDAQKVIDEAIVKKQKLEQELNKAPEMISKLQRTGAELKTRLRDLKIVSGGANLQRKLSKEDVAKAKVRELLIQMEALKAKFPELDFSK